MKRFYNIQAGYDLAQRTVDAIYGILEDFDYFEDFVDSTEMRFAESIAKPMKHTLLHTFLENLEQCFIEPALYDISHSENFGFLESYLKVAGVELPEWFNETEIDKHSPDVKAFFPEVTKIVAETAFEILFNDREFLYEFQLRLREVIQSNKTPHPPEYYEDNWRVKRLSYFPRWLERALYYRDRGRCQKCLKDVSGEVFHHNIYHIDHVLPLVAGGSNDPTNFQLLCRDCNLEKGAVEEKPQNKQVKFWEME